MRREEFLGTQEVYGTDEAFERLNREAEARAKRRLKKIAYLKRQRTLGILWSTALLAYAVLATFVVGISWVKAGAIGAAAWVRSGWNAPLYHELERRWEAEKERADGYRALLIEHEIDPERKRK